MPRVSVSNVVGIATRAPMSQGDRRCDQGVIARAGEGVGHPLQGVERHEAHDDVDEAGADPQTQAGVGQVEGDRLAGDQVVGTHPHGAAAHGRSPY